MLSRKGLVALAAMSVAAGGTMTASASTSTVQVGSDIVGEASGAMTASASITGVTLEGPSQNQSGTIAAIGGSWGWISLNEQLSAGQRLVMDKDFFDDLFAAFPNRSNISIGIKDPSTWSNSSLVSGAFINDQYLLIVKYQTGNTIARHYTDTSETGLDAVILTTDDYEAFFELTADGNNIRFGQQHSNTNQNPTWLHDLSTTQYTDWDVDNKVETGDQGYEYTAVDVVMKMVSNQNSSPWDTADVDWTGLTIRSIPTPLNITYDSQGGSAVSDGDVTTIAGGTIDALPSDPTRGGYTFAGWHTAASGGTEITTGVAHNQTADFTLYAQWIANPTTTTTEVPTTMASTTTVAPTTTTVVLPATGSSDRTVSLVLLVLGVGGLLVLFARRRLNIRE
ncbi:MAG: hypothetical protein CL447_01900 [Acidimicrobiaceae bacterium]|nr:hypothetical protein [Acidimicrobiaceae bacterium]HBU76274.1 hypothetical protein [Acidimicrobiaceae bacterium]